MRASLKTTLSAAVLAGLVVLSGCSGGDDEPTDTESQSSESESASSGADQGIVTEEGDTTVTTYQTVPPDFPSEVPILDESEATGSVTESPGFTAYSVVAPVDSEPVESLQEAVNLLVDEGFEGNATVSETEAGPAPVSLTLADPDLLVIVSSASVGEGSLVTYSVEAR